MINLAEGDKIIKKYISVKTIVSIFGKKKNMKWYYPPTSGDLLVTNRKIIFLSQYSHTKTYSIGIIEYKKNLGVGETYVELPICKILDYSVIDASKKGFTYFHDHKKFGTVGFILPIDGDFLNPDHYFSKKEAGPYHKYMLEGKWQIEEFMKNSIYGPIISVGISDLPREQLKDLSELLQKIREACMQEDLPFVLRIGYEK